VTLVPTSLNSQPGRLTSSQKIGVVIGSALGGLGLIVGLLFVAVIYRRNQRRKVMFAHRRLGTPRRSRLEEEDDFDLAAPANLDMTFLDDQPRLLRARATESGSIFHEGVWPPPGHSLVDPIMAASEVDLSSIVDSVMGNDSPDRRHQMDGLGSGEHIRGGFNQSSGSGSGSDGSGGYAYHAVHARDMSQASVASQTPLVNRALITNSPTSPRSVTFVDSPRATKAREASAGRSRLSIATVPTENTPLTEDIAAGDIGTGNRERPSRASTASLYSTVSLHPQTGLPPGAAPAAPPPLLVDVDPGPEYHGQAAETMREIPPLYHMIRRDTSSSENWQDAMDNQGNENSLGQAL